MLPELIAYAKNKDLTRISKIWKLISSGRTAKKALSKWQLTKMSYSTTKNGLSTSIVCCWLFGGWPKMWTHNTHAHCSTWFCENITHSKLKRRKPLFLACGVQNSRIYICELRDFTGTPLCVCWWDVHQNKLFWASDCESLKNSFG